MVKGLFYPFTPSGKDSMMPELPWHYTGNCMVVEFEADSEKLVSLLPEGLSYRNNKCAAYFFEWQANAADGKGYLDPFRSQYKEALFLVSATYKDRDASFCPYIWVDNDIALQRGLLQGYPKQLGEIATTRIYPIAGHAAPVLAEGGEFAGACAAKGHRLIDGHVTLKEKSNKLPDPFITNIINRFTLPNLTSAHLGETLLDKFVVKSNTSDVEVSEIWSGDAELTIHDDYYQDLGILKPVKVTGGSFFSMCFTLNSLEYEDR